MRGSGGGYQYPSSYDVGTVRSDDLSCTLPRTKAIEIEEVKFRVAELERATEAQKKKL
jgi:hypothetical protein